MATWQRGAREGGLLPKEGGIKGGNVAVSGKKKKWQWKGCSEKPTKPGQRVGEKKRSRRGKRAPGARTSWYAFPLPEEGPYNGPTKQGGKNIAVSQKEENSWPRSRAGSWDCCSWGGWGEKTISRGYTLTRGGGQALTQNTEWTADGRKNAPAERSDAGWSLGASSTQKRNVARNRPWGGGKKRAEKPTFPAGGSTKQCGETAW